MAIRKGPSQLDCVISSNLGRGMYPGLSIIENLVYKKYRVSVEFGSSTTEVLRIN